MEVDFVHFVSFVVEAFQARRRQARRTNFPGTVSAALRASVSSFPSTTRGTNE